MKIGFITQALPYLPSRGGFRLYGANLIRWLSRSHQIDLVSLLESNDEEHLDWPRQYCASVTAIPKENKPWLTPLNYAGGVLYGKPLRYRAALGRVLETRARTWDVLHVEGGYLGGIVDPALSIPKVLSLHDSWTLRCEEMLKCAQSRRERLYYKLLRYYEPRFERLVYPRFDRCTLVADRDVEAVNAVVPNCRAVLIPYGTDTDYFHPISVPKQEKSLVFHSHLGYPPNIEAALEFANDVLPLVRREMPDATFHLIGADPAPKIRALASKPGITLSANLPDLRSTVCSGSIYVCAIRHGTGLKSKMLEAMGMRMPIVCYPGSTVGLECTHGKDVLVAADPQQFAAHVVTLLRDPARAYLLAHAGRKLVEEKYSWESKAKAYESLYAELIEERRHEETLTLSKYG